MDERGFTLLETVLVIAIIGILSSIIVPKFKLYQLKANVVSHNASVEVLKSAGLLYHLENPEIENISEEVNFKDYIEEGDLFINSYIAKKLNKNKNDKFKIKFINNEVEIDPGKLMVEKGEVIRVESD